MKSPLFRAWVLGWVVSLSGAHAQSITAYAVPEGQEGNQAFGGGLGMDFVVNTPISVTELGVFDDASDGLNASLTVAIWSRHPQGSPDDVADDSGEEILAQLSFSPESPGTLEGGSRFKILPQPLQLPPGDYTIVASGYGDTERNGNAGNPDIGWTTHDGDGLLTFVGGGRWGNDPAAFPPNADGGPENRYAAGTFKFEAPSQAVIAYQIEEGTEGNQEFGGSLGMDFVVIDAIQVTELGAFDDLSDGFALPITVQLWTRDNGGTPDDPADDLEGEVLQTLAFTPDEPGALDGGSRFKALDSPLTLPPGDYTIVAWGYGPGERNGNGFGAGPFGTTADVPALQFVGTSHWGDPEAWPANTDSGPENRYGAGTFKFIASLEDADGDGWDDRFETRLFGDTSQSPGSDADEDGASNQKEIDDGTDPLVADSDGDGLLDGAEADLGTDPLRADSDGDGLADQAEIDVHQTDPLVADSDGDGAVDGAEVVQGFDPLDAQERPVARALALEIEAGTAGNQGFGEGLGMDFIVESPIEIFELGAFDDGGDGLKQTITVSLWSRDDSGTPEDPADDQGIEPLVRIDFEPGSGFPNGGHVLLPLEAPLQLAPGAYTIVAHGYGPAERNGNSGGNGSFGTTTDSGALTFVGTARWGGIDELPPNADGGPANRYGAGTFTFERVRTDSDGDGFEDPIELAMGSDPQDAGSTPPDNAVFLTRSGAAWDAAGIWSDGEAPSAGKDYYVISGVANRLRVPPGDGIFAGDRLTFLGESAVLALDGDSPVNISANVQLIEGATLLHDAEGEERQLEGTLHIESGSRIHLGSGNRALRLAATLTGTGPAQVLQSPDTTGGLVILAGTDNTFSGEWSVEHVTLQPQAFNSLGSGGVTLHAGGRLDADYNINNPVSVLTLLSEDSVVVLDQEHVFATFVLGTVDVGAALGAGTFTQTDLLGIDPALEANFVDGGGSITIGGDTDGDQLLDEWEQTHFGGLSEDGDGDNDGDGLLNRDEFGLGGDPNEADTDGDGLSDGEERERGTQLGQADTDGDGLLDPDEVATDPTRADTDGDGLLDGEEINLHGTDPTESDSDGDGALDGLEVAKNTDPLDAASTPPNVAYVVPAGTVGNQAFGGSLGMDFNVLEPIDVTELGAFDSEGDGINLDITVELWTRDEMGTPGNVADDTGGEILASLVFTSAEPGVLQDGSRFKPLAQTLRLSPGAYAIVAYGYGDVEPNGNQGSLDLGLGVDESGALEFVGTSHWGDPGAYPTNQDGGPENRYAAGTFSFVHAGGAPDPDPNESIFITRIALEEGQVVLQWSPLDGGATYRVEGSPDLTTWEVLAPGLRDPAYSEALDANVPARYYRISKGDRKDEANENRNPLE